MERLIAEVILQKWSNDKRLFASDHNEDNQNPNDPCCSKDLTISAENPVYRGELSSSASQQPIAQSTTPGLDCAKVRLLSEQLWRRLERKYELKLQAWKKSEEKQLEEMLEKLRAEYKQSIDAKHTQYAELASRKEDELRKLETRLKEDFRLEQEKYQLKLQQEWRLIEAEKRDLRAQKDQLETAKSNFSIKMQHEEMCLKRDQTALTRMNETLLERKRKLDEAVREKAISKAGQIQENWLNEMVNEWNEKEAKLSQKCSQLAERVQQMSELPNKIRQQDEIIQRLKVF
ncbi:unnamed protein product [Anisakis simplex]|uniref:Coiled-coil domain-containing protein 121 n=1 Tax=Anisakis simplex TaxID=6269 RepID=A0A0M3J3E2_ANISI|nr:unnamed protein product [Anisakis simplex]